MGQLPDLQQARRRLGLALNPVCYDRWVLGYLRGGWLQPIAASEVSRRFLQGRPLMPLSRRALFEMKPVIVNSVFEKPRRANTYDWELDWPAIVYAPVGADGQRPVGLLIIGCRHDHWYSDEDIDYVSSLGIALSGFVTALRRPFSRLDETENEVLQLLSYGLSKNEVAHALRLDANRASMLIDAVARKLRSVTAEDLAFPLVERRRDHGRAMTW
jgi:DNA-binding CsgD family transcriptional regulator